VNIRILFPIPGCILSPRCLNIYITPAQLNAATTANGTGAGGIGLGFAMGAVSGGSGWVRGWMGLRGVVGEEVYRRGRRERRVRDIT
jgi:hypothetical protein